MGRSSRICTAARSEVFSDFGLWYGSLWAILNGKVYYIKYTERKVYILKRVQILIKLLICVEKAYIQWVFNANTTLNL